VPDLDAAKQTLLAELREHSLVIGEVTLSSGQKAQYYVDARRALLRPAGFLAAGELIAAAANDAGATAVGGPVMAAIPLACAAIAVRSAAKSSARIPQASVSCTASVVSRISDDVNPWCIQRAAGPTEAATFSRNAITSWFVRFSISAISGIENIAFFRISAASSLGICPRSAIASQARVSISSQIWNLRSSDQSWRIRGRE